MHRELVLYSRTFRDPPKLAITGTSVQSLSCRCPSNSIGTPTARGRRSQRRPFAHRDSHAHRKSAAKRAPLVIIKREVAESSIESVEFVVDEDDEYKVEAEPVKIEADPCQLRAGVAALTIRPPASVASTSSGEAAASGPSRCAHRTEALCRIPAHSGPAQRPRPAQRLQVPTQNRLGTLDVARTRGQDRGGKEPREDEVGEAGLGGPYANPPQVDRLVK